MWKIWGWIFRLWTWKVLDDELWSCGAHPGVTTNAGQVTLEMSLGTNCATSGWQEPATARTIPKVGRRRTAGRIRSEETRTTQARSQLLSHRKTVAGKCENHKKLSQRKLSGWELESAWNVGLRCDCARSKWTDWQLLWMPPLQVIWC